MAEGPLVHTLARQLRRALKGRKIRVEFGVKALKPLEASLGGAHVKDVEAYGKQFRIKFDDGRVILVHLMMWGWWRIYKKGEPWERPRERARVVLRTSDREAVAFSAPVVRLFAKGRLDADPTWGNLGPDPLRKDFSRSEFLKRLKARTDREVGDVLLDQRVLSGVGNILKIEILFGSRIHPRRRVRTLTGDEIEEVLVWTMKLMNKWVKERGNEKRWIRIYGNKKEPCPRCGGKIAHFRQGGRITYACPKCQPLRPGRPRA